MSKGLFIASQEKGDLDFYKDKAKLLDIDVIVIPDLDRTQAVLSRLMPNKDIEDVDISTWRFSYWVERNLLKRQKHKKKSHPEKKCFQALEDYYFEVNSGIFFAETIAQKVDKLYSTFQKYPRISPKCGNELMGKSFDDDYDALPGQLFADSYYKCHYNDIQVSTFVEHLARLAILKNAVDYKLYKKAGITDKTDSLFKILGHEFPLIDLLPSSFRDGLNAVSRNEHFHRYPVFWQ